MELPPAPQAALAAPVAPGVGGARGRRGGSASCSRSVRLLCARVGPRLRVARRARRRRRHLLRRLDLLHDCGGAPVPGDRQRRPGRGRPPPQDALRLLRAGPDRLVERPRSSSSARSSSTSAPSGPCSGASTTRRRTGSSGAPTRSARSASSSRASSPTPRRGTAGSRWRPGDLGWEIAALNLVGSIFFGLSAIAAYVVPSTGELLNAALANAGTFLGALGFLVGAAL